MAKLFIGEKQDFCLEKKIEEKKGLNFHLVYFFSSYLAFPYLYGCISSS